jgi:hypothetical protein
MKRYHHGKIDISRNVIQSIRRTVAVALEYSRGKTAVIPRTMFMGSRPACGPESNADAEHGSSRKRYKWQDRRRPSHSGSDTPGDQRRHRRVHRVHESESPVYETAGENEADYASGERDKDLQHIEFPE